MVYLWIRVVDLVILFVPRKNGNVLVAPPSQRHDDRLQQATMVKSKVEEAISMGKRGSYSVSYASSNHLAILSQMWGSTWPKVSMVGSSLATASTMVGSM